MSETPTRETQSDVSGSSSGTKGTTIRVELPKCTEKIKIKVVQKVVMLNMITKLYEMEVKVHPMYTLKKIRAKLTKAENLKGWPLPANGYSFRRQPRTENDADNDEELIESGGMRTFKKLGIQNGDTILVVPSSFPVNITGMGIDDILVTIRPLEKVVTLREELERRQPQNLPDCFKLSVADVLMEDDMPLQLYNLRRGSRVRVTHDSDLGPMEGLVAADNVSQ